MVLLQTDRILKMGTMCNRRPVVKFHFVHAPSLQRSNRSTAWKMWEVVVHVYAIMHACMHVCICVNT